MFVRAARYPVCFTALAIALLDSSYPSLADDVSSTRIIVTDRKTKKLLPLVRVRIVSTTSTYGFTGPDGVTVFRGLRPGRYKVYSFKARYETEASQLDVGAQGAALAVSLVKLSDLTTIGTTSAARSLNTNTLHKVADDQQGSNSLLESLALQSDVLSEPSTPGDLGIGSVGIDGRDPSQTEYTNNGIPLGSGLLSGLRSIGSDLYSAASIDPSSLSGSASSVTVQPFQPTRRFRLSSRSSIGENDGTLARIVSSGSTGRWGGTLVAAERREFGNLHDLDFRDESGLQYLHKSALHFSGISLLVRDSYNDSSALTSQIALVRTDRQTSCANLSAKLPCGFGPGVGYFNGLLSGQLENRGTIGAFNHNETIFGARQDDDKSFASRVLFNHSSPLHERTTSASIGTVLGFSTVVGKRDKVNVTALGARGSFNFVSDAGPFTLAVGRHFSFTNVTASDTHALSPALSFRGTLGVQGSTGSKSHYTESTSSNLLLTPSLQLSVDQRTFVTPLSIFIPRSLQPPSEATFDCRDHEVVTAGGSDPSGEALTQDLRVSLRRTTRRGIVVASLYKSRDRNALVRDTIGLVDSHVGVPAGYLTEVERLYRSELACGSGAAPLSQIYVSTAIAGPTRMYESASVSAQMQYGRIGLLGSLQTSRATISTNDARFSLPSSLVKPGQPLSSIPQSRGSLIANYSASSRFEALAAVQYEGPRNIYQRSPFSLVSFGIGVHNEKERISIVLKNVFNTAAAPFASLRGASALNVSSSGSVIPNFALPAINRSIYVRYDISLGRPEYSYEPPVDNEGGFQELGRLTLKPLTTDNSSLAFTPRDDASCGRLAAAYRRFGEALKSFRTTSLPSLESQSILLSRIEPRAGSAIAIIPRSREAIRLLFVCSDLHIGDVAAANALKIPSKYVTESGENAPFLYSELVGIYNITDISSTSYTTQSLPKGPPLNPFQILSDCPKQSRAPTQILLDSFQQYVASSSTKTQQLEGWAVSSSRGAFELTFDDAAMYSSFRRCVTVSEGSKDQLLKLGIVGTRPPKVSFSQRLGFFIEDSSSRKE